jgi:hypothetical protein
MAKVFLTDKSFTVSGRTFSPTEMANLVELYCNISSTNVYSGFRKSTGSGGFQIPAGKKFVIKAIRIKADSTNADCRISYGDTDVGINSGSPPTNVVHEFGGTFTAYSVSSEANITADAQFTSIFEVPAGKYLTGFATNGVSIWAYGTLENV